MLRRHPQKSTLKEMYSIKKSSVSPIQLTGREADIWSWSFWVYYFASFCIKEKKVGKWVVLLVSMQDIFLHKLLKIVRCKEFLVKKANIHKFLLLLLMTLVLVQAWLLFDMPFVASHETLNFCFVENLHRQFSSHLVTETFSVHRSHLPSASNHTEL